QKETSDEKDIDWLAKVKTALKSAKNSIPEKFNYYEELAEQLEQLSIVNYEFLLDKNTKHLSIGYNVDELRRDDSFYDMLASEARMGVFVGIAQGMLPQESWFSLGRLLTDSKYGAILLSWSG